MVISVEGLLAAILVVLVVTPTRRVGEKRAEMQFAHRGMKICDYSYFYGLRWLLAAVGSLRPPAGQTFCLWKAARGAGTLSSHPVFAHFPMC